MKKVLRFLLISFISFLAFAGVESILHEQFGIDLHHLLALGGVGTIIILGFKLHIFCCVIPAIASTIYCTHKKHEHCDHPHKIAEEVVDKANLAHEKFMKRNPCAICGEDHLVVSVKKADENNLEIIKKW